jgi:hypothetical protein
VLPPVACASSFLYPTTTAVLLSASNPATFCMALPSHPAFLGAVFCLQGASLENSGCLRASDGLVVVTQ